MLSRQPFRPQVADHRLAEHQRLAAHGFEPADCDGVVPGLRNLSITLRPRGGARVTVLAPDGTPADEVLLRVLPLRKRFLDAKWRRDATVPDDEAGGYA